MKNFSYIIPNFRITYFLLVILLTSFLIVPKTYASDHHEDIDLFKLFLRVFTEAEKKYVDEIDKDQLMDSALKGMLNSLDPYSTYLSEEDFEEMDIDTKGFYGGLGLEVTLDDNGFVRIVSPIDDTPGSRAGLISGDYITGIDGEDVYGMSLDEAVDRMRGYANTSIILTIYRDGDDAPFDVEIVREIIQIENNFQSFSFLPLICYEIIYSGNIFNNRDFDFIVNISEDGWFGQSIGPHQHFVHSIFRAIESGKYVIRSANNGIAAIVNPLGIVEKKVNFGVTGYIDFNEKKIIQPTVFSRYGNKTFGLLILLYIFLIFSFNRINNE